MAQVTNNHLDNSINYVTNQEESKYKTIMPVNKNQNTDQRCLLVFYCSIPQGKEEPTSTQYDMFWKKQLLLCFENSIISS